VTADDEADAVADQLVGGRNALLGFAGIVGELQHHGFTEDAARLLISSTATSAPCLTCSP
jgi:hypothetical protein